MKIGVINSLYKPYSRGGTEVVAENVIAALRQHGYDVFLITLGRKREKTQEDGVLTYRIKPKNIFSFIDIPKRGFFSRLVWQILDVFSVSGKLQVKKILEKEKPDVVMTHNIKGIGYLLPGLLRGLKIRHIHYVHDVQLSRPSGLIFYGAEKPFLVLDEIYEGICRKLFGSPEIVISPSRWLMSYHEEKRFFPSSKKLVVRNPVSEKLFEKTADLEPKDVVRYVFIGQLEESKGVSFLLDAFSDFLEKNWELKIIGRGTCTPLVERASRADSRIQHYGYVRNAKIPEIIKRCAYLIVPSLCYENSPTVIYESLAAGVPVIASDIGGVAELVSDGENGYTFIPGDKKRFVKTIEHCHKRAYDEAMRRACQESIREYALSEYGKKISKIITGK